MDKIYSRLPYLFNSYFDKTATEEERDELFRLIQLSENDQELSGLISEAWENIKVQGPLFELSKSEDILSKILHHHDQEAQKDFSKPAISYFYWIKPAVAAIVLVFISVAVFLFTNPPRQNKQIIVKSRPLSDAFPGGNKAILKLANGKTIILDNTSNGVLVKIGNTKINKAQDGLLVYKTNKNASQNPNHSINTITTPRGGQYQIVLSDGSKVWLNAASSLSFPTQFTGNYREVKITGEAYFEVAKNAAIPFRVKTGRAEIEVLGTHFNVMAYDDENEMKTTLLEGAIKIKSKSATNIMQPGQQAITQANGQQKVAEDPDADDAVAWKNGIFQFRDASIEDIMRQVARWYDVRVSYEGKIPVRQFTGRISRNVKASVLLNMLRYTGVNLKIEGNKIIVTD